MCAYKCVRVESQFWGINNKVEQFTQDVQIDYFDNQILLINYYSIDIKKCIFKMSSSIFLLD